MKSYFLLLIMGSFFSPLSFAGLKYAEATKPLSAMTNLDFFQKNRAADYWSLAPYYVPQETPRGCSAANLSMVLNAARVGTELSSSDKLITFKNFIEEYSDEEYKQTILGKTKTTGTNFSNKNLTRLLNAAAEKLKISGHPEAKFFEVDQKEIEKSKKQFLEMLKQNEKSNSDFIIFSFIQGKVTGDPEGGAHVATVAAYDEKKNLVLVMDPDREWYEPYWTPADQLFDAIRDPASDSRKEAGWIYFKVR